MSNDSAPAVNLRFLYAFCNDVEPVRHFYTELLGMQETNFRNSEEMGWVVYQSDGLELMFFRLDKSVQDPGDWAWQPGGTVEDAVPRMSFSILVPWTEYAATVERLQRAEVRTQSPQPVWRQDGYFGLTVADPAGNTVEVCSTPPEKPESTTWPVH